jgi:hypothetical protein
VNSSKPVDFRLAFSFFRKDFVLWLQEEVKGSGVMCMDAPIEVKTRWETGFEGGGSHGLPYST